MEMMVTVAVAAILVGIGMPAFSSFIRDQKVKTASFDLSAALILARSEAIKRNGNVVVEAAAGGWQDGWTIKAGTTVLGTKEAFEGISIEGPTDDVIYANNGRVQGTAPEFEINGTSSKRCIQVTLSGHPTSTREECQ